MFLVVLSLFIVILSSALQETVGHATATFLEEPRSQYTLIGNSITFYCRTFSHETYWIINDGTVNPFLWNSYRSGFIFSESDDIVTHSHNLTLTIAITEHVNLTTVACTAYGGPNTNPIVSRTATLYVFNNSFPPPPQPSISVRNGSFFVLSAPYLWADYDNSYYNITLVKTYDSVVFPHLISSANNGLLEINIEQLSINTLQPCSKYTLNVFVQSPVFGLSTPLVLDFISPAVEMPTSEMISTELFFNSTGAPFLAFTAVLNKQGICHLLNYTYVIHLWTSERKMNIGPKVMPCSGVIHEVHIGGLEADMEYTAQLEISFPYYTLSTKKFFDIEVIETNVNKEAFCGVVSTEKLQPNINQGLQPKTASIEYDVAVSLGVLCALLALLLVVFSVICIHYKRKRPTFHTGQRRSKQSSDAMVTNPIYSGPVYETVPQNYNPLSPSSSCTSDSTPTTPTPLLEESRYNINPTSRSDILDLVRRNTLPNQPNGRVVSPLAGTSYRSSSMSGNTTVKHPPRERNKLHLTLSLHKSNESAPNASETGPDSQKNELGKVSRVSEDENYTIMSPAGNRGFGGSNNGPGRWGEVSPELTSKYHE